MNLCFVWHNTILGEAILLVHVQCKSLVIESKLNVKLQVYLFAAAAVVQTQLKRRNRMGWKPVNSFGVGHYVPYKCVHCRVMVGKTSAVNHCISDRNYRQ